MQVAPLKKEDERHAVSHPPSIHNPKSASRNQLYSPPFAPVPSPGSPAPVLSGSAVASGEDEPVFIPSGVCPCCAPYSWLSASVVTFEGASSSAFVLIVSPFSVEVSKLSEQVEWVLKNLLE